MFAPFFLDNEMVAKRTTIGLSRLRRVIGGTLFVVPIVLLAFLGFLLYRTGSPEVWRRNRMLLLSSLQSMTNEYLLRHQQELDFFLLEFLPETPLESLERLYASLTVASGDWISVKYLDEAGVLVHEISGSPGPEDADSTEFIRNVAEGTLRARTIPRSLVSVTGNASSLFGGEVFIIDENGTVVARSAAAPDMSLTSPLPDISGSDLLWLELKTGGERITLRTLPVQSGWQVGYLALIRDRDRLIRIYWIVVIIVLLCMGVVIPAVLGLSHHHVTGPLKRMAARARGFSGGTPVLVREHFRVRELDYLNQSIGEMMDIITLRENTLRLMNESLEDQVESRTRAYQETIETLRSTRDQLLLSEKMAVLGSLVSGVAHEINTPMSIGITAASYLNERTRNLMMEWDAQTLTKEALEQYLKDSSESSGIVQTNLDHASRIINSLKQVAVDQQLDEHREFELTSYIKDILLSLKHQLRPGKHQIAADSSNLIMVDTYPGVITQIINNLVFNSITHGFADREGGQIRIYTRDEGDEVFMEYQDNGRGLEDEESQRIFEQFYTTRLGRGGTGLGMNIVLNLVQDKLGGGINITPPEDGGAGFTVRFPKDAGGKA